MHPKTKKVLKNIPKNFLKEKFFSGGLIDKPRYDLSRIRHEYLKDKYNGETAYILTCGPSLDKVWNDELRAFLSDKLVISVKQTQKYAPEICDFHLYNQVRMQEYNYNKHTIRIGSGRFNKKYPCHIYYPIRDISVWDKAIFVTNEYEKWDLKNSYIRPWGVGIMFELGLQLPVYLGCKKIVIIGFDMNSKGKYHFYDKKETQDRSFYNVKKDEFKHAPKTIPFYLDWCKSKSVDVKLYSPMSALPFEKLDSLEEVKKFVF